MSGERQKRIKRALAAVSVLRLCLSFCIFFVRRASSARFSACYVLPAERHG